MGETRAALLHLLEDLRDAYTGAVEETVLTEIAANSLDSGATRIDLSAGPAALTPIVRTDGVGMQRPEMARFHDTASSTRTRGADSGSRGSASSSGCCGART